MRLLCLLFLLVVGAAVTIFVMQNKAELTLTFFDQSLTAPVSAVVGVAYGLGMLTGWSVVGLLRRSWNRMTAEDRQRYAAR